MAKIAVGAEAEAAASLAEGARSKIAEADERAATKTNKLKEPIRTRNQIAREQPSPRKRRKKPPEATFTQFFSPQAKIQFTLPTSIQLISEKL